MGEPSNSMQMFYIEIFKKYISQNSAGTNT